MNKTGKKVGSALVVLVAVLGIIASAIYIADALGLKDKWSGKTLSQVNGIVTDTTGSMDLSQCVYDKQSSVTVDVQNLLNTTGAETFDVTAYLKSKSSGQIVTITDTTNPSASSLNCGETYTLEVARSNSNDGDNSRVRSIINGPNAKIVDGVVEFTPTSKNYNLRLGIPQHGVLSFAAYDNDLSGDPMCYGGATPCTTYQTDGVSFTSTTNGTAKVVATDGWLDLKVKARATLTDTDFTDYYTLILVEAPYATWQEPSAKVNGVTASNIKGKGVLTPEEETAFSGYEYIYKVSNSILDGNDGLVLDFYMAAKSGVNPSVDPEIDFASAGRYLSVDGVTTKVGAADDTSTNAVVFDVQDVTLDIS